MSILTIPLYEFELLRSVHRDIITQTIESPTTDVERINRMYMIMRAVFTLCMSLFQTQVSTNNNAMPINFDRYKIVFITRLADGIDMHTREFEFKQIIQSFVPSCITKIDINSRLIQAGSIYRRSTLPPGSYQELLTLSKNTQNRANPYIILGSPGLFGSLNSNDFIPANMFSENYSTIAIGSDYNLTNCNFRYDTIKTKLPPAGKAGKNQTRYVFGCTIVHGETAHNHIMDLILSMISCISFTQDRGGGVKRTINQLGCGYTLSPYNTGCAANMLAFLGLFTREMLLFVLQHHPDFFTYSGTDETMISRCHAMISCVQNITSIPDMSVKVGELGGLIKNKLFQYRFTIDTSFFTLVANKKVDAEAYAIKRSVDLAINIDDIIDSIQDPTTGYYINDANETMLLEPVIDETQKLVYQTLKIMYEEGGKPTQHFLLKIMLRFLPIFNENHPMAALGLLPNNKFPKTAKSLNLWGHAAGLIVEVQNPDAVDISTYDAFVASINTADPNSPKIYCYEPYFTRSLLDFDQDAAGVVTNTKFKIPLNQQDKALHMDSKFFNTKLPYGSYNINVPLGIWSVKTLRTMLKLQGYYNMADFTSIEFQFVLNRIDAPRLQTIAITHPEYLKILHGTRIDKNVKSLTDLRQEQKVRLKELINRFRNIGSIISFINTTKTQVDKTNEEKLREEKLRGEERRKTFKRAVVKMSAVIKLEQQGKKRREREREREEKLLNVRKSDTLEDLLEHIVEDKLEEDQEIRETTRQIRAENVPPETVTHTIEDIKSIDADPEIMLNPSMEELTGNLIATINDNHITPLNPSSSLVEQVLQFFNNNITSCIEAMSKAGTYIFEQDDILAEYAKYLTDTTNVEIPLLEEPVVILTGLRSSDPRFEAIFLHLHQKYISDQRLDVDNPFDNPLIFKVAKDAKRINSLLKIIADYYTDAEIKEKQDNIQYSFLISLLPGSTDEIAFTSLFAASKTTQLPIESLYELIDYLYVNPILCDNIEQNMEIVNIIYYYKNDREAFAQFLEGLRKFQELRPFYKVYTPDGTAVITPEEYFNRANGFANIPSMVKIFNVNKDILDIAKSQVVVSMVLKTTSPEGSTALEGSIAGGTKKRRKKYTKRKSPHKRKSNKHRRRTHRRRKSNHRK